MKNLIHIIASIVLIISGVSYLTAQTPHLINYQAVARNTTTGQELAHQPIFVSIKILEAGPTGEIVYQESHDGLETNYLGLFNLFIGGGEPVSGSFDAIQWGSSEYWLAVDIDAGQGLQSMGSMQFVAVPYALHAETVSQIDDADADPTNELVQDIEFNTDTKVFSLIQEGGTLTLDLSALIDDADADPTNELVEAIGFNTDTKVFSLIQEGGTLTQDLSALIDDADADPTNELINSLTLVHDTILKIQEGPTGEFSLNLAALKRDENWTKLNTGSVSNIGSKVGIGTSTPASTFEVEGSVGYKVTLLESTLGAVNYTVSATDHIIVCKIGSSSTSTINITMPDADSCPGRSITIRKTGTMPIVAPVVISFGDDMIDFGDGIITLGDYQRETVTFISLGSNGWTKL